MFRPNSIRLKDYDYSLAGAYFVTICIPNRDCILGRIEDGTMILSEYGRIVDDCWDDLPKHYDHIILDQFIVMPNHVHGIVILTDTVSVGVGFKPTPTQRVHGLSEIVRGFKTFSARRINELRNTQGCKLWQRNYHDRIIRNEIELKPIREYIYNNPINWDNDSENPRNVN